MLHLILPLWFYIYRNSKRKCGIMHQNCIYLLEMWNVSTYEYLLKLIRIVQLKFLSKGKFKGIFGSLTFYIPSV